MFNAGESSTPPSAAAQPMPATASAPPSQDPTEAKAINDSLMAKYNGESVTYTNDEIKSKNKKALFLYLLPQLKKGSLIGDSNMELDIIIIGNIS